jgi:uncharacterized protein YuzE
METILEPRTIQAVAAAVPLLLKIPMERFWVDYDKEADVLYISFRHPQKATDTRSTDDGILLRYHGKELVGITVLEASTRAQESLASSPKVASRRSRKSA